MKTIIIILKLHLKLVLTYYPESDFPHIQCIGYTAKASFMKTLERHQIHRQLTWR